VVVQVVVAESEYDKAMQAYKIHVSDLGDKEVFIRALESHDLSDEDLRELKAELSELQEELEELRDELKELATDTD